MFFRRVKFGNTRSAVLASVLGLSGVLHGCGGAEAQTSMNEVSVTRVSYPQVLGPAAGPYSDGVKHNGFLYLSGLTAIGTPAQGRPVAQQVDQVLTIIENVAAAEGTSLRSLVKVTIFVTDLSDLAGVRAALSRHYGPNLPASSLVRVAGLFNPDLNAEIEAVFAVRP